MCNFTYRVDIVDSNLYFIGEINIESVNEILQKLHILEKDSDNITANLYLTSDGGVTTEGLKLFDILQNSRLQLTIYVVGQVSSAATLAVFTRHKTKMYKNAILGFHELNYSHDYTYSNAKSAIDFCDKLMCKMINIYSSKNKIITKEWLVLDKFIDAREALELSIIDEVVS